MREVVLSTMMRQRVTPLTYREPVVYCDDFFVVCLGPTRRCNPLQGGIENRSTVVEVAIDGTGNANYDAFAHRRRQKVVEIERFVAILVILS